MIFPTVPAIYLQAFYEIDVWLYEIAEFGDEMYKPFTKQSFHADFLIYQQEIANFAF